MKIDHLPPNWQAIKDGQSYRILDETGTPRCGARNRQGKPCNRPPAQGANRCKLHGGASPKGNALPQTKDGRYSKYLPTRLQARYQDLAQDENLLDLSQNVALIDVRISELAERIDVGDYGAGYTKLKRLHRRLVDAIRQQNTDEIGKTIRDMGDIIEGGSKDYAVWQQLLQANEQRRRVVTDIEKIRLQGERAVSLTELMLLITRIVSAFERANAYQTPEERLRLFTREIDNLLQ